jgi:hypothetical protein
MERKGLGFERCGTGSENLEAEAVEPEEAAVGSTSGLVPEARVSGPTFGPVWSRFLHSRSRGTGAAAGLLPCAAASEILLCRRAPCRLLPRAAASRPDEYRTWVASCNATKPLKRKIKKERRKKN